MKRILMALAAGVLLAGLSPARADQPDQMAALTDPSEFEVVAVIPRNPEAKPIVSSIPVMRGNQGDAGHSDRQDIIDPRGDRLTAKPGT